MLPWIEIQVGIDSGSQRSVPLIDRGAGLATLGFNVLDEVIDIAFDGHRLRRIAPLRRSSFAFHHHRLTIGFRRQSTVVGLFRTRRTRYRYVFPGSTAKSM